MNPLSSLFARLGLLLFITGVLLGLSLSAGILWGEIEVRLEVPYTGSARLQMKCPLLLSPAETGKIEAVIVNSTEQEIKPRVSVDLNRGDTLIATRTILLAPFETQPVEWTVDGSNVIFDRLILINVFQSPYRDNPSRLGSCSILSFSLFGLRGTQTLSLLFAASLAGILCGGGLWLYTQRQSTKRPKLMQAGAIVGILTIAALFSSVARWWGITLVLDSLIMLLAGVLITEFGFFPQSDKT